MVAVCSNFGEGTDDGDQANRHREEANEQEELQNRFPRKLESQGQEQMKDPLLFTELYRVYGGVSAQLSVPCTEARLKGQKPQCQRCPKSVMSTHETVDGRLADLETAGGPRKS